MSFPASSKEKRILGVRAKWFWALILLIAAICIGVAVGAGVGMTRNRGGDEAGNGDSVSAEKESLEALEERRKTLNLPALAVGQSTSAGKFTSQVTGVRKQGDPTPVLVTDRFHLGSNTKPMTATLLAIMIQEGIGNLTWQTTLAEALPTISNMSEGHRSITLEMLTSHRSGINDERLADDNYSLSLHSLSPVEGRRSITQRLLSEPRAKAQGTFTYENANYLIVGFIIDVVSNSTFEEVASARLFEPLGMSTAGFGPLPESSNTSVDSPWPHNATSSSPTPVSVPLMYRDNPPAYGPAGGAYCAMSDYNKFLRLQLDGMHGRINASSPFNLSTAAFQHLHTAYAEPNILFSYTYGGWRRTNLTDEPDDYRLSHRGSNTMNFAVAEINMKPDTAYMAMTNAGSATDPDNFSSALDSIIKDTRDGKLLDY